ncbi:hypothetical protein C1I98_14770 [Spongiactinospora gelatinilytica]|uniref:Uncharacterized protein n=1 Tax=Spongiactinospora gelatinilytica TaxID=2666298 RepID=A0A2W2GDU2_9ACTN|nr:hypothetical protein C1I98_14770 [Spongiactinospora gelatinilytica]
MSAANDVLVTPEAEATPPTPPAPPTPSATATVTPLEEPGMMPSEGGEKSADPSRHAVFSPEDPTRTLLWQESREVAIAIMISPASGKKGDAGADAELKKIAEALIVVR